MTESTPTNPISPYGKSKLMAEAAIIDAVNRPNATMGATILRYFNVIGADLHGFLGEAPPPVLAAKYGRISDACFFTALGQQQALKLYGTNFPTPDGTCIRDYIHVVDVVDAHIAG